MPVAYRYHVGPVGSNKTNVFRPTKLVEETGGSAELQVEASQIGAIFSGHFNTLLKGNPRAAIVWEVARPYSHVSGDASMILTLMTLELPRSRFRAQRLCL